HPGGREDGHRDPGGRSRRARAHGRSHRPRVARAMKPRLKLACLLVICAAAGSAHPVPSGDYVAGTLIQLNDNGAWSWFMDERAIVDDGKLIVGSVRAVGDYRNDRDPDWGNVEVSVYDLASGAIEHTVLHRHLQQDDHDNPAFLALPDGRYLAMYTQHGVERRIYYGSRSRTSRWCGERRRPSTRRGAPRSRPAATTSPTRICSGCPRAAS